MMPDKISANTTEDSRREFLNRAGKVAVTAPAAALLLAASTRANAATVASFTPPPRRSRASMWSGMAM